MTARLVVILLIRLCSFCIQPVRRAGYRALIRWYILLIANDSWYLPQKGAHPPIPTGINYNLVANPEVSVEVGTEQFQALATIAAEPEYTHLYKQMETMNSIFTEYKSKTTRIIPLIILTRKP